MTPTEAVPTPRTDACAKRIAFSEYGDSLDHWEDFARQLERELIAEKATDAELVANLARADARNEELKDTVNDLSDACVATGKLIDALRTQLQKAEQERDEARVKAIRVSASTAWGYLAGAGQQHFADRVAAFILAEIENPTKPAEGKVWTGNR